MQRVQGCREMYVVVALRFFIVIFIVIFLGHFFPRGKGAMRLSLCKAPTRKTRPDHNIGNYVPYSFREVCGFFNVPC